MSTWAQVSVALSFGKRAQVQQAVITNYLRPSLLGFYESSCFVSGESQNCLLTFDYLEMAEPTTHPGSQLVSLG